MTAMALQDAAGRRRSPATLPGFHVGRPPRNKGPRYPADPPNVEEIVAVMRHAGTTTQGLRVRALIVVLWRAGLRIGEALALTETDLDERRGSVLVRHGKGDKRREVGMDDWGWQQLQPQENVFTTEALDDWVEVLSRKRIPTIAGPLIRLDEQSDGHRVKQDRRGLVPEVVEDGQAVGQSGEVSEHPVASCGTHLEHGGRVERRHQDGNARAIHHPGRLGIGGDVVLGGGLEGLAVAASDGAAHQGDALEFARGRRFTVDQLGHVG